MKTIPCLAIALATAIAPPLWPNRANAAQFCATNSTELQTALDDAEGNEQDDVIRIHTGTYSAPAGGFNFNNRNDDDFDITISGGWTEFFGYSCGQQLSPRAIDTRLSGNGSSRVMRIYPNVHTDVHVELITFVGGNTASAPEPQAGAGLDVSGYTGYLGSVSIERNIFMSNVAGNFGGGLSAGSSSSLVISNNVFFANQSACAHGAATLTYNGPGTAFIINNTVAFNSVGDDCTGSSQAPAGGLRLGGLEPGFMVNNIFWGNENFDLDLDTSVRLVANNYATLDGTPAPGSGVNYNLDPKFRFNSLFDLHLAGDSPLIDLGLVPLPTSWELTDLDLDGNDRIAGNSVDLGAYENFDAIFADGFEDP